MSIQTQPRQPAGSPASDGGQFAGVVRTEGHVDLNAKPPRSRADLPVSGPVTGARYLGVDMGEDWNGSPVVGFTYTEMYRLIRSGDGADSNGEGLAWRSHYVLADVSDGEETEVPTAAFTVGTDEVTVYVPEGRIWDEAPDDDVEARAKDLFLAARPDGAWYCAGEGQHRAFREAAKAEAGQPPVSWDNAFEHDDDFEYRYDRTGTVQGQGYRAIQRRRPVGHLEHGDWVDTGLPVMPGGLRAEFCSDVADHNCLDGSCEHCWGRPTYRELEDMRYEHADAVERFEASQ